MSHRYYEGRVTHRRFTPKTHAFSYDYFFLDFDPESLSTLQNALFSLEGFNLFSFSHRDHFGAQSDFALNAKALCRSFGFPESQPMRFITLPRILGYVFNPISLLLLLEEEKPTHLLAEVHNYNGGRVVYPMTLQPRSDGRYSAWSEKSMYVSPFMHYGGNYHFIVEYTPDRLAFDITLKEEQTPALHARFEGAARAFDTQSTLGIFWRHTFLNLFVVTRTLYQSLRLKLKGLQWVSARPVDQIRRY